MLPEEECRAWVTNGCAKIARFRKSRHHADALNEFIRNGPHSPDSCDCKVSGLLTLRPNAHGYVYKWQHEHLREFNTWWLQGLRAIDSEEYMRKLIEADILKAQSGQDHWITLSYAEELMQYLFSAPPSPKWVLPGQL